jgi:hypothetical protein
MPKIDLSTNEALMRAAGVALADLKADPKPWYARLRSHLDTVQHAGPGQFAEPAFLHGLWEDDSIASTGLGGMLDLKPLLENSEFRQWFSHSMTQPLPEDMGAAEQHLKRLYDEIERWLQTTCGGVARLKLNRVLCARFPQVMTTVASVGKLRSLFRAMGGSSGAHPIHAHLAIRERLDKLLGPHGEGRDSDLDRLSLPWYLYQLLAREENTDEAAPVETAAPSETISLFPRPASVRRKGLTSVKGYFSTILELLPLLQDGLTRDEFRDEVMRANPALNDSGARSVINSVAREFDLCANDGNRFRLNARGLDLLDSRNPDELADHLLTRILGPDFVLSALGRQPLPFVDLVRALKDFYPGWTTDFMPRSVLLWMVSLDLIAPDRANVFSLTQRGKRWAAMVTWEPDRMEGAAEGLVPIAAAPIGKVQLPSLPALVQSLSSKAEGTIGFPADQVRQLHAGLWSHPVRHFAVLTGISGSGKTQLALRYAESITMADEQGHDRVNVIPVQPAWYDPAPLLGYVSPITNQYLSTPFLDLLLRAVDDPDRPYVVILDEMNLSHPEQYMAPLLSAMETRGWIDLHDLDGTEIPKRVRYPGNLALIGTVNMDETTHGLSDKVLDRAFTLEFWDIPVEDFPGWAAEGLDKELRDRAREMLIALNRSLSPVRLHFGWRTIDDVLNYLRFLQDGAASREDILDEVVYARILPKLRGESSERFRLALESTGSVLRDYQLLRSASKVRSMLDDLRESGMARFWR